MENSYIFERTDHTLLSTKATNEEILKLCSEAVKYNTASVCIPPSYIKFARGNFPTLCLCTVIGFPNGYNTTAVKVFETAEAVKDGADEIDMVINLTMVKNKEWDNILNEINEIKNACNGKLLKVIIETCDLTEEEKIKMCEIVSASNADYIKTSTGFSKSGATAEDIILMRKYCRTDLKIKAAGGISTREDAENFLKLGADRLGSSRIVKLLT